MQLNEDAVTTVLEMLTWYGAAVGVLSIILNVITINVYRSKQPKKYPTYTLYICMALADIANGLNGILTLLIYKTQYKQILCTIKGPITMTCRLTLDYLTLLSIGRLTAIAFPFYIRTIFSFRNTLIYVSMYFALCCIQYVVVPATGGSYDPLDYGWCAPRLPWTPAFRSVITTVDMLPMVINSLLCICCFIASMVLLRRMRSVVTDNTERDRSIKTLQCLFASFVVCFGPWVVLDLLGSFSALGVTSIYISIDEKPSCGTKLLYKLMLTGIYTNGTFNALFLLRGAGKLPRLTSVGEFIRSSILSKTQASSQDEL